MKNIPLTLAVEKVVALKMNTEYNRSYYINHRGVILEQAHRYYQDNKEACKLQQRQYYLTNKEGCKTRSKKSNDNLKWAVLSHYSIANPPSCARCGINDIDILCVDHINGNGNNHRRQIGLAGGGTRFYRWLKQNNFPDGMQILCFNCNMKKRMMGEVVNEINSIN